MRYKVVVRIFVLSLRTPHENLYSAKGHTNCMIVIQRLDTGDYAT